MSTIQASMEAKGEECGFVEVFLGLFQGVPIMEFERAREAVVPLDEELRDARM